MTDRSKGVARPQNCNTSLWYQRASYISSQQGFFQKASGSLRLNNGTSRLEVMQQRLVRVLAPMTSIRASGMST